MREKEEKAKKSGAAVGKGTLLRKHNVDREDARFVRSGSVGGWREKLSPAQIEMVTAYAGEALRGCWIPGGGERRSVGGIDLRSKGLTRTLVTGESMTRVIKKSGRFLAMMVLLVPLALAQKKDGASDSGTLRKAADPMGFWVGTTIQGRMWNHDPQYKPVMGARVQRRSFHRVFRI